MTNEKRRPVINLAEVPLHPFDGNENFKGRIASFGHLFGSTGIGCMLHEVEPGEKIFPFHVHHVNHELFIILEGEGTYRFGDEHHPIRAGDICAAPAGGPEFAHQIINTGSVKLRYLGLSTKLGTEVVEYPDSAKFGVTSRYDWSNPAAGGIRFLGRTKDALDYFDGER